MLLVPGTRYQAAGYLVPGAGLFNKRARKLTTGPFFFPSERLVQRYCEPDLSDVGIGVRVLHGVAIPVRRDAHVASDADVVAHTENCCSARLRRAAESGDASSH